VLGTLAVENYRSLRRLIVPLRQLNVVIGPNGSGKSNLYRALRLLADSARNGAVAALAREGGLPSTLWAGPQTSRHTPREARYPIQGTMRDEPVSLRLGFSGDEFGYAVDFGVPIRSDSAFHLDPEIKRECTWRGPVMRPATLVADRHGGTVHVRKAGGTWHAARQDLRPFDSMLSEVTDPRYAPDLLFLREQIRSWRFYDHVRTDAQAPARRSQVGTRTPVLSHDGSDLAAALQTIREIGDDAALDKAVDHAFPGSSVEIINEAGRFELTLTQHGLLRPLGSAELSDGTLRYLLWVAALLTPRPPALLVLNEPETSLHPDLFPPLAELIVAAAAHTQIAAVTHSRPFVEALQDCAASTPTGLHVIELTKESGQTHIVGQETLDEPSWHWPKR
jgi:predicted ATPase